MESFNEMRLAQPPKDRLNYFDIVLEGTSQANATLLQKLYNDIIARSNVDFGSIPDTKGNLLRYKEYPLMQQSMDAINRLFEGVPSENVKMMNELHDMIISCRKDYEFGFAYDIEILKLTYNSTVMSLYEMINLCILTYTKKMKDKAGIELGTKKDKNNLILIRNVKGLLKQYKEGQWAKIIATFKKDPRMMDVTVANESLWGTKIVQKIVKGKTENVIVNRTLGDAVKSAVDIHNKIPAFIRIPLDVVAVLVTLLFIIRGFVALFYSGSARINDYSKTQKAFLDAAIQQEKEDGTPDTVISKHTKLSERLSNISTFIETKIFRMNKEAKKDIQESNAQNFTTNDFKGSSFSSGGIEF